MVTFTNGRVSLTKDLIFGVSVLSTDGWVPLSELDEEDIKHVQELLDFNPTCPRDIYDAVYPPKAAEAS